MIKMRMRIMKNTKKQEKNCNNCKFYYFQDRECTVGTDKKTKSCERFEGWNEKDNSIYHSI